MLPLLHDPLNEQDGQTEHEAVTGRSGGAGGTLVRGSLMRGRGCRVFSRMVLFLVDSVELPFLDFHYRTRHCTFICIHTTHIVLSLNPVDQNQLTGSLPSEVGLLTSLTLLDLGEWIYDSGFLQNEVYQLYSFLFSCVFS